MHNLLREKEWQCTSNKWMMYEAVGVNTNSFYGKIYRCSNKVMEEHSTHFICIPYQGKQNNSVLSTKEGSWSKHKFSPIQNVWAAQQISSKIILTFECNDGETIYTYHLSREAYIMALNVWSTYRAARVKTNLGSNSYSTPQRLANYAQKCLLAFISHYLKKKIPAKHSRLLFIFVRVSMGHTHFLNNEKCISLGRQTGFHLEMHSREGVPRCMEATAAWKLCD